MITRCSEIPNKHFLLLSIPFIILIFLSGCSGEHESNSEKQITQNPPELQEQSPEVIALVMKTLTNPFFQEMENGARRAEKDLGIQLLVKTAAQETWLYPGFPNE